MAKLIKALVAIVIVVLIVAGLAWYFIDTIARTGIEKGATYALGVETTVDDLSLSLLNGTMTMDGLTVSNPEGYTTPHLVRSGRFDLKVDLGTILKDKVVINRFHLDGLDMNIELKGLRQSNISVILGNLKRFKGPDKQEPDKPREEPSGKKIVVDRIVIENVVAHIHLASLGSKTVKVPRIELESVSNDGQGLTISELTARLLPAILAAVLEEGEGIIPDDLADALEDDLDGALEALGDNAAELVKQSARKIGEKLKEKKKELGDKLKGIFGDKNKKEQ